MSTMNALGSGSGEIALWAINQQPEQSARFVASTEQFESSVVFRPLGQEKSRSMSPKRKLRNCLRCTVL
jgi:hypothetical protein